MGRGSKLQSPCGSSDPRFIKCFFLGAVGLHRTICPSSGEEYGEAHIVSDFASRVAWCRFKNGQKYGTAVNAFIILAVFHVSSLRKLSTSVMLDARSNFRGFYNWNFHHVVHMDFHCKKKLVRQ